MNIVEFKKISHDVNGNPRYYIELDAPARDENEMIMKKLGLRKWRNGYGFKWVITSYETPKQIQSKIVDALKKMK